MSLILDNSFIHAVGQSIRQQQMITVTVTPKGTISVRPLGVFERIGHWNDTPFHEKRLSRIANIVTQILSSQKHLSIEEAAKNYPLIVARSLLKQLRQQQISTLAIDKLSKQITATKLGISAFTLDHNPGLQHFTETYHLERYLLGYNHQLEIHPKTSQILLQKDGKLQKWGQIWDEVKRWPIPSHSPHCPWIYGPEGIQNKDMYEWTELKPFKKGNPADWNHQYIFECCVCYNPYSIKNGNHSWIRLKTPAGDIYSVGLYRPGKTDLLENLNMPLRIKPGFLMQPDVSEFWDMEISTIDFSITEEMFLKIKHTVESDKKNEDLVFQLFNNNCLLYCKKLALIGGVDIPTIDNVIAILTPPKLLAKVSRFMNKLPESIQKICLYSVAFFLNVFQILLGGSIIDKNLNEKQKERAVPHFKSFRDLFDINKIYLHHPITLAFKTRQNVLKWRQNEIEALELTELNSEKRQEKENAIKYSLPPSYYTHIASM